MTSRGSISCTAPIRRAFPSKPGNEAVLEDKPGWSQTGIERAIRTSRFRAEEELEFDAEPDVRTGKFVKILGL